MQPTSPLSLEAQWPDLVAAVSAAIDLEATARSSGALIRRREIRSAEALLRLALAYGPGGLSLAACCGGLGRGQRLGGPVRHGGDETPLPSRPLAGRAHPRAAPPPPGRRGPRSVPSP